MLASASATFVDEGQTYQVDQPEIVRMQAVERQFTAGERRSHRRFGVDRALRVRLVEPGGARFPALDSTRR